MKRILACILCLLTGILCFSSAGSAARAEEIQTTEVLENGDALISGIGDPLLRDETTNTAAGPLETVLRFFRRLLYFFTGTKTVERSKFLRYYDANGVLLWEAVLTAEFTYSEKQVRCETAKLSFTSLDPDWALSSKTTAKAGDAARGTVSVRQTKLGVPLQTVTRTIVLTCDNKGNIN